MARKHDLAAVVAAGGQVRRQAGGQLDPGRHREGRGALVGDQVAAGSAQRQDPGPLVLGPPLGEPAVAPVERAARMAQIAQDVRTRESFDPIREIAEEFREVRVIRRVDELATARPLGVFRAVRQKDAPAPQALESHLGGEAVFGDNAEDGFRVVERCGYVDLPALLGSNRTHQA
ncbi:hypothetical protein ACFPM7_17035 [Actinokineospora guangxiensis]|uniref:Uncharacterized protein n=2 Tax=Actinokineospora guangxiensis TaxID=1490288 RepID=A0ABW0ERQ5_9PSEU